MDQSYALQKTVLLGFSDIAAAGCRALLGVDVVFYSDAEKLNYQAAARSGIGFLDPGLVSCKGSTELDNTFSPVQIINIPSKNVSLVIINCRPSWQICHELISGIVDMFVKNNLEKLFILTALVSTEAHQSQIYEKALFKEKTKEFMDPPKGMKTSDEIFNLLMQLVYVAQIPASCFIVTAKKAREGNANREDGTLACIQTLQALAEELTGVKFNLLTSRELVYSENKEKDSIDARLMYL